MATRKINENCHYVQNHPNKCKIKLEKFHFDILYRFGVIKESLPGGADSAPPPPLGEIGLIFEFQNTWLCTMKYKEKTFEDSASYSNVIKENQHIARDKLLK